MNQSRRLSLLIGRPLPVVYALNMILQCGCSDRAPMPQTLTASDSVRMINSILQHRASVDSFFRYDSRSPFQQDTGTHFEGIKWFPPDLGFYVRSRLHRYEPSVPVVVLGTKGEERRQLKVGFFEVPYAGRVHQLNAYKEDESSDSRYLKNLSVWFTDATTNKETYGVGRYLDVGEENPDSEYIYTLDFNAAYNPYCAYSSLYSCAIPRREDHFDIPIRAGETKYHQ